MKATEHVTVIMNTFNERIDWLKASIAVVSPQVDMLIVSVCEGDTNYEWLMKHTPDNVVVVVLPYSQQLGKCPQQSFRQINNAIAHVDTKYVSWTSSDDLMSASKYQDELDLLVGFDKKVCYSDYYMTDENLSVTKRISLGKYDHARHLKGNFVSDLSLMETALLTKYGLQGDKFRNYAFWDMWLRIYEGEGDVFINNAEPTWYYRQDPESTHIKRQRSADMQAEADRDRAYMLSHHTNG
jgi:hypothetical protein